MTLPSYQIYLMNFVRHPGGTLRKIGWGCADHFPKPLHYLWPKSAIFPYPIYDLTKIQHPVYDRFGWHSCPKHNFWRAFDDGLVDNDEKVASSKKTYPIQDEWKNHTLFETKIDTLFMTRTAEKPYPLGPHIPT